MVAALAGKLFSGIGLKILGALAIVAAVLAVLANAKRAGRMAERVDGMKRTLKSVEKRNEIARSVSRADDAAVDERLRADWTRH